MKNFQLLVLIVVCVSFAACSGTRPTNIGINAKNQLVECPSSPNCVSTFASKDDKQHSIAPLTYTGSASSAMARLKNTVSNMKRTNIVKEESNYMYVEFTTATMRFVDDVEFLVDDANKTIHFRSASRLGHSDLGANRKRMEKVRTLFNNASN